MGIDWLLFTIIGASVVAPWTRSGWLMLLDWTSGPHATLSDTSYGLDSNQISAMPLQWGIALMRHLVGPATTAWLLPFVVFPIGGIGMGRLVSGPRVRRVPAGLLYVVNPFVLERLRAGHIPFLLAVALLPWAIRVFVLARQRQRLFMARAAGWMAVLISISPHMAFIAAVPLLSSLVWPLSNRRDLARVALLVLATVATSAYVIVIYLAGVKVARVGEADLVAFRTRSGTFGLAGSVVSLGGFWRALPRTAGGSLFWLVVALTLALITVGVNRAWRGAFDRTLTITLFGSASVGLVLACGDQGPLGSAYRTAYDLLPLFRVMREPDKWLVLTAIGYAAGFGLGVEHLAQSRRITRIGATFAAVTVPLLLAPGLLFGLGGQVRVSHFPAAWATANRIMGPGTGSLLLLPWHEYVAYNFTGGRTVAVPGRAYFERPVISGDNVELPGLPTESVSPRSAYLEQLFARGGRIHALGRLIAPLGVQYVALTRTAGNSAYAWVTHQRDLIAVLRRPDLTLYRNTATGVGRVAGVRHLPSIAALIAAANVGRLGSEAVLVGTPRAEDTIDAGPPVGRLHRPDPTRYAVGAGRGRVLVVPESASPGWRLDDRPGLRTLSGVLAFTDVPQSRVSVGYKPWGAVLAGELVSATALLVMLVVGLFEHRVDATRLRRTLSTRRLQITSDPTAARSPEGLRAAT